MKRLGILISGRGSNMESLAEAVQDGRIPEAEIALVISNAAMAEGLEKAHARGIETLVIDHCGKTREELDRIMAAELHARSINLVCLAGYSRLLSSWFVREFKHRILNIHPSLLPAFPGLYAQQQALEYGVRLTGCTVHIVDEHMDHGPIIQQAVVPIESDDTVERLTARILREEHRIYPQAVALVLSGQYRFIGRRVIW